VGRERRSENMHKTIFSKVSRVVGGARVSTVGLGVMLAVILLGLTVVTAFPTPALANHGPRATQFKHKIIEGESLSSGPPPYTVGVETSWTLQNLVGCTPGTLQQKLERQDNDGPFQVVWQGTETGSGDKDQVRDLLQASMAGASITTYRYRHTGTCLGPTGDTRRHITIGPTFYLSVTEDQRTPVTEIDYTGTWIQRAGGTGGTTHEARQVGATATSRNHWGIAAAWVTTVDEKPYPIEARIECDYPECPATRDTGSDPFGDDSVVKWSSSWNTSSNNSHHDVTVISEENRRVDVDAFVVVIRY